jgi:hypothetical protein
MEGQQQGLMLCPRISLSYDYNSSLELEALEYLLALAGAFPQQWRSVFFLDQDLNKPRDHQDPVN